MKHYDIALIGAGFAGLACAKEAAVRGLSVVVLERKQDVREHIHTTGIFVNEAADEYELPAHLVRPIQDVRLYAPSLRYADLNHPSYQFFATDTPAVMQHMTDDAVAHGVEVRLGAAYEGHEVSEGRALLHGHDISARFLVGADGARSKVARHAGLSQNSYMLKGAEYEYDHIGGLDNRLHVFLGHDIAPGYIAWAFRGVGVCQVGVAATAPNTPDIQKFLHILHDRFDFSQSTLVGKRGGWIPVGATLKNIAKDNVLLVGDAAGMVSPLTAGGIFTALHYGKKVAGVIDAHLNQGAEAPAELLPTMYPRFRAKSLMRRAIDLGPPDWSYELLVRGMVFRKLLKGVFYTPARGKEQANPYG